MTDKPHHRRLCISLRAFMLLVLAIGVWLGWQVDRVRRQRAALAAVKRLDGVVWYDYEYTDERVFPGRQPWGPRWLRRRIGNEFFQEIALVGFGYDEPSGKENEKACDDVLNLLSSQHNLKVLQIISGHPTDGGLARLSGLTHLEELDLWESPKITDAGIESIRGLVNLKELYIKNSKISDRGLLALADMTKLKVLILESHSFSDRGVYAVAGMKDLTWLDLSGSEEMPSRITDESLPIVARLKNLKRLSLSHTRVTDDGLAHLNAITNLGGLELEGCKVGDQGLRHLSGLKNLGYLVLRGSDVSDEGLRYVRDMPKLVRLELRGSKVTEKGRLELKKDRPYLSLD